MSVRKDLTGQKFGDWTVGGWKQNPKNTYWECTCVCGKIKWVLACNLVQGKSTSCGCSRKGKLMTRATGTAFKELIRGYRRRATKNNMNFNFTDEEFREITQKDCYYCGLSAKDSNIFNYRGIYQYNGIDRINSSIGYEKDNCVPCCWNCNKMKSDLTSEDFIKQIEKVYKFFVLPKKVDN